MSFPTADLCEIGDLSGCELSVPVPESENAPDRQPKRTVRHEAFLDRLGAIGTKRDPAWQPTAAGLRLLRFLDSWVELGADLMRGDAPVLQLREGVEAIRDEWADVRTPLLVAYDALAFIDVAPDVQLTTDEILAAWMRAVCALADASDAFAAHGYADLARAMYAAILERLPPEDDARTPGRPEAADRLEERAREMIARLEVQ